MRDLFAIVATAAVVVGFVSLLDCAAHGQEREITERAHLLAMIVAGEAGLHASPDEVTAIAATLDSRARRRGVDWHTAANDYTSGTRGGHGHHWDQTRTDARRWVAWLRRDGSEPHGWPDHLDWDRHHPGWMRILHYAQAYVDGRIRARCRPHHYGGDVEPDNSRAARAGWTEVQCGRTRNRYWRMW